MKCSSIVNQKVCIEAKVTVDPKAKVGDVHASCVGEPQFEKCGKKSCGCTYMVSQMLRVRFPLTLSASASAKPAGIICQEPNVKPCSHDEPFKEDIPCEAEPPCLEPISKPKYPDKTSSCKKCDGAKKKSDSSKPSHKTKKHD